MSVFWTNLFGGGTGSTYTTSNSATTVSARRIYTTMAASGSITQWYQPTDAASWITSSGSTTSSAYWDSPQQAYLAMQAQEQQTTASLYQQHARLYQQGFQFALHHPHGLGQLFTPSAPAIISHEQRIADERAQYDLAIEQFQMQEAERIARRIHELELASAEERRRVEERAQLARDEHARREAAHQRAQELLLEHLSPAQRDTLTRNGWFIVEGGRSGTKYRIRNRGVAGNIDVLGNGDRVTHRLCCHAADGGIPQGDQWLSQKIMLELAEDEFLRKANRHAA